MDEPETSQNRLTGLALSIFAPGIGQIQAGNVRRGISWFVAICLTSTAGVILFAAEGVPVIVGPALILAAFAWMLIDNFKAGEMSPRRWRGFFAMVAIAFLLTVAACFVVRPFKIPTSAMEPTLRGIYEGSTPDHVISSKIPYLFGSPQRGDLIVFRTSGIAGIRTPQGENQYYVKRVIGLPGEHIEIRDGDVFADGKTLTIEDGIPPIHYTNLRFPRSNSERDGHAYIVGEEEYFVLGDFSANSADSRVWGNVPAANIQFKVTKIYWPISRRGKPEWTDKVEPRMTKPQRR